MRLKLDRKDDRGGSGTGKLLFVLLILGWASLCGRWCGVVIGCESDDVTEITLYIGADESAAGGHPTAVLWRCPGDSFGWHIHWEAGEDDEPDFEGEIYIGGTGVDPITADGADREKSGTASALSAGGVYTVECWLKREGGEWCVSNGRTMKIVEVELECVCHPSGCTLLPCKRLCTNAQDCYKKTKWKAKKVKPAGTTATVSGSGVSLTGIGCSLTALSEGDEFWVEAGGSTGIYSLTLRHNDRPLCSFFDMEVVFKFEFDYWKYDDTGGTAGGGSKDEAAGTVSAPKTTPPDGQSSGAHVVWFYKTKVTTVPSGAYAGKVKAEGEVTLDLDGTITIWCDDYDNTMLAFAITAHYGIITISCSTSSGTDRYYTSIGACRAQIKWDGKAPSGSATEEWDYADVPPPDMFWASRTWAVGPDIHLTGSDMLRTYTVNSTEQGFYVRADVASNAEKTSGWCHSKVTTNDNSIASVEVNEEDGEFEITP